MIKAIFLDFDGTLFSHVSDMIPDSTLTAINKCRENGVKVFICTGRAKREMTWFDLRGITFDGMILSNGQVILDENENVLYENPIQGELLKRMEKIFYDRKQAIYFISNDDIYLNVRNDTVVRVQQAVGSEVPEVKEYHGEPIIMASAFFDNEEEKEELMSLKDMAEVTLWHQGAVDIVAKGSTKSSGIDIICKEYGIDPKDTIGFGDGENDIPMLNKCGLGIAMGNATDELKKFADYITDSVDEDGIYNALIKYNVI